MLFSGSVLEMGIITTLSILSSGLPFADKNGGQKGVAHSAIVILFYFHPPTIPYFLVPFLQYMQNTKPRQLLQ